MHHQLAASGNLGQVIRRNYPIAVGQPGFAEAADASRPRRRLPVHAARRAGHDVWTCPMPSAGDLVVVFQAGAYGTHRQPA